MPIPAVFISHGSPDLPLHPSPTRDFLQQLASQLEKPKAILCISAHWGTRCPTVSAAAHPRTIHDFGGFPAELYQLNYPAPGDPALATKIVQLLNAAEIECEVSPDRGLDHGAWNPLLLMYPAADVPVLQLSVQPYLNPAYHWAVGQALAPLRHEGVLVLGSGSTTHNLREFGNYFHNAAPPAWVSDFVEWLTEAIAQGNTKALLDYRQLAPHAIRNHPSEEHLLPLFVAMGAGGEDAIATQLHSSYTYGVLSMAAYMFH